MPLHAIALLEPSEHDGEQGHDGGGDRGVGGHGRRVGQVQLLRQLLADIQEDAALAQIQDVLLETFHVNHVGVVAAPDG